MRQNQMGLSNVERAIAPCLRWGMRRPVACGKKIFLVFSVAQ